jgi:hypothetical protein
MRRVQCALGLAFALVFALVSARPAHACAGCRNPSLPTSRGSEGPIADGAWALGLSLSGTLVDVVHDAGCGDLTSCDEVPIQPAYEHDQSLYPVELRASVEYGVSALLGIELQLPFRVVTTTIEYTTPAGDPYVPLDRDVHHRDEVIAGFADPWLLLRVGGTFDGLWLAARPGLTLPLGRTEEDPFRLGDRGERHQHIQLGTGTFDPVLVLEAGKTFGAVQLQLFTQTVVPLYENHHGYRAPWRVHGGGAASTKLVGSLSGKLGVEAMHEAAERWQGVVRQDGSLGRSELLGVVGLTQAFGGSRLSLDARLPVARHIVAGSESPGTLSSPAALSLRFDHVFGAEAAQ